jgi:hypothetical protein
MLLYSRTVPSCDHRRGLSTVEISISFRDLLLLLFAETGATAIQLGAAIFFKWPAAPIERKRKEKGSLFFLVLSLFLSQPKQDVYTL